MSKSREQLVEYLSDIDITDKLVLDVGCGPEKYWTINFTKGEPGVYHTLDINKEFDPTYTLDLNRDLAPDMSWIATPQMEHYDIVFSIETLEHIYNPVQAIKNIWNWLKVGGEFYFSTPLLNPLHDTHDMLRYTDEWYSTILPEYGFRVDEIKPRVATDGLAHLIAFYKTEGLRISKIRLEKGQGKRINEIGYMGKATKRQL